MSGHSKWHKVKHRKAQTDSKKSKLFSQTSREIRSAARAGGTDPAKNAALRDAIERAKKANVPQENIDRLLTDRSSDATTILYEGYGPAGSAFLITATTDNTNRTVAELRALFKKHGGSLGERGSVRWKFTEHVTIEAELLDAARAEAIELTLIDAGATNVTLTDHLLTVTGPPAARHALEQTLDDHHVLIEEVTIGYAPQQHLTLSADDQQTLQAFIDILLDHPDVTTIYTDTAQ